MSNITAKTKMCVIIGDPVEHSLSPAMHNAAYEALGIDNKYVFTAAHVKAKDIRTVVQAMRVMELHGLTCTIPHKVEVMKYLDEIEPVAQKIGAVNTVINENNKLVGYNTDHLGITIPLTRLTTLKDKHVALIGAGGAARAFAFAMTQANARLTIYNRTLDTAQKLATEFKAEVGEIKDIAAVKDADIIFNSTSLGMGELVNETPVPDKYLHKDQIIFDAVYIPYETRLLREAKAKGAHVLHGLDMLLHQGTAQFELYTRYKAPEEIMHKTLLNHFNIHA